MIPLTVPEVRRLVLAMAGSSVEERDFRLGWSVWRRAHQAVAARCRRASHAARRALGGERAPRATALPPEEASLTDEQWELVCPLLPPERGSVGRPPDDHREVLGGILWVARTGSSWREMPEEYGDFTTAYKRWRQWEERGLWRRILETLGEQALPGPVTKDR